MSQGRAGGALWALVGDLFLRARVEGLARGVGRPVRFFPRAEDLRAALEAAAPDAPAAVVLDLGAAEGFRYLEGRATRAAGAADPPTLGFYSHVEEETRRRALALGATRVVPRSAFVQRFAALLEELGGAGGAT
jgi:DNA-binding NarL/FixJ family response regulator